MHIPMSAAVRTAIHARVQEIAEADLARQVTVPRTSDVDASELLTRLSLWPHHDLYTVIPHGWLELNTTREVAVRRATHDWPLSHQNTTTVASRLRHAHWGSPATWGAIPEWQRRGETPGTPTPYYTDIVGMLAFPLAHTALTRPMRPHGWGEPDTIDPSCQPIEPTVTPDRLAALRAFNPRLAGLDECQAVLDSDAEACAIRAKWATLQTAITAALKTATSVNTLVAQMPEFRAYLPDELRTRLDTKKAPAKKMIPLVEVSADLRAAVAAEGMAFRLTQ